LDVINKHDFKWQENCDTKDYSFTIILKYSLNITEIFTKYSLLFQSLFWLNDSNKMFAKNYKRIGLLFSFRQLWIVFLLSLIDHNIVHHYYTPHWLGSTEFWIFVTGVLIIGFGCNLNSIKICLIFWLSSIQYLQHYHMNRRAFYSSLHVTYFRSLYLFVLINHMISQANIGMLWSSSKKTIRSRKETKVTYMQQLI